MNFVPGILRKTDRRGRTGAVGELANKCDRKLGKINIILAGNKSIREKYVKTKWANE